MERGLAFFASKLIDSYCHPWI